MGADVLLMFVAAVSAAQPLVRNGDFETGPADKLAAWQLSSHYAGEATVLTDNAASGARCVRLRATSKRPAHMVQVCEGLRPGHPYKVSFAVRDGQAGVRLYEYPKTGPVRTRAVGTRAAPAGKWRRVQGYYTPPKDGLRRLTLVVAVRGNASAVVDNVRIEPVLDRRPVTLENETARLVIAPDGRLQSFVDKASGTDYAVASCKLGLFETKRDGVRCPMVSIRREGDVLRLGFLDADIRVAIHVTTRPRYFVFRVLDVRPDDVTSLALPLGVKPLKVKAGPMGATYDDTFGIAHMAVTPNTITWVHGGGGAFALRSAWFRRLGGMKGGTSVLVACPFAQFLPTIQQMQRDLGLPCPMFDGQWAKRSDRVRRSYLFVTKYEHGDVDELIRYAKIGGFDLILFLMNTAFQSYGHYEVNRKCFPEGLKTLREVSDKIHAAGLRVGVHLFAPSVSSGDSYVTPKPDDRLCYLPCPPLTHAVDAAAKTLTLAGAPERMPFDIVRIGDEIVTFSGVDKGPPYRLTGCLRGAFRTKPAPHPAGSTVRAMLRVGERYNFLLANHDTSILKEMTESFGRVVNQARLDMVYFDGAGGFGWNFRDRLYFLQKWILAYYRAFDHDVLFQYSSGTGHGVLWHIIPRAASADGHGDLKGYLDTRLKFIVDMKKYVTAADVGWYGMDMNWKPDQLEYVAAKCLGTDGSISVQANLDILNKHPRAREIMEMLGRYERCRLARHFPEPVKQKLIEKKRDFKLVEQGKGHWTLYRAAYDTERRITALDGKNNVWSVHNPLDRPCRASVEIERRAAQAATPADFERPGALVLADYRDMHVYDPSQHNQYAKYAHGPRRVMLTEGPAMQNVTPRLDRSADGGRDGTPCLVFSATNADTWWNGWCGRGKRFVKPLDLSAHKAFGMWVHGDGQNETFFAQLVDRAGRVRNLNVPISFTGWQFCSFARTDKRGFDWKRVEYLILYLIRIPGRGKSVSVKVGPIKALARTSALASIKDVEITVGRQRLRIPVALGPAQCVTTDGLGHCTFWAGGMKPGRAVETSGSTIMLQPGANKVTFGMAKPSIYPGDVSVRFCRVWPLADKPAK